MVEAKTNDELININAQSVDGKTVVTINFPYNARFGKATDDNILQKKLALAMQDLVKQQLMIIMVIISLQ